MLPSLYDYVLSLAAAVASCSPCCGSISVSLHVALPHSLQQPPHLIGLGTLQTIESSDVSHVDEAQAALPLICCREPSRSLIVRLLSAAALIVPIGTGVLYYWAILEATMLTFRANARVVAEQGRKARSRAAPFSRAAPTQAAAAAL